MIPCRPMGLQPELFIGAPNALGYHRSESRRARLANWAGFRKLARSNGCSHFELAVWLLDQDVPWTNGIQIMRYVLGCTRSEAETALWAAGVKP